MSRNSHSTERRDAQHIRRATRCVPCCAIISTFRGSATTTETCIDERRDRTRYHTPRRVGWRRKVPRGVFACLGTRDGSRRRRACRSGSLRARSRRGAPMASPAVVPVVPKAPPRAAPIDARPRRATAPPRSWRRSRCATTTTPSSSCSAPTRCSCPWPERAELRPRPRPGDG